MNTIPEVSVIIPTYRCTVEVAWPRDCVISSIRRNHTIILPHGDTLIKPGDVLVVVTEGNGLELTKRLCNNNNND
jgi:Trk K+ transport system NAD-binding subunit